MEPIHLITSRVIQKEFSFLQDEFNFSHFKCYQTRDEYYVSCLKNEIEFSTYIPIFSQYCPSISILYKHKKGNSKRFDVEKLNYSSDYNSIGGGTGIINIENYIKKCANILKENSRILLGNCEGFLEYSET